MARSRAPLRRICLVKRGRREQVRIRERDEKRGASQIRGSRRGRNRGSFPLPKSTHESRLSRATGRGVVRGQSAKDEEKVGGEKREKAEILRRLLYCHYRPSPEHVTGNRANKFLLFFSAVFFPLLTLDSSSTSSPSTVDALFSTFSTLDRPLDSYYSTRSSEVRLPLSSLSFNTNLLSCPTQTSNLLQAHPQRDGRKQRSTLRSLGSPTVSCFKSLPPFYASNR